MNDIVEALRPTTVACALTGDYTAHEQRFDRLVGCDKALALCYVDQKEEARGR